MNIRYGTYNKKNKGGKKWKSPPPPPLPNYVNCDNVTVVLPKMHSSEKPEGDKGTAIEDNYTFLKCINEMNLHRAFAQ